MKVAGSVMRHAHSRVMLAKQHGDLSPKPCEVCGTTVRVQAHHEDYDRPLDVRWLCQLHHKARHKEIGKPLTVTDDLRIRNIDPKVMWRLKSEAALAQVTLGKFVLGYFTRGS
jgi:hypothetical protein